MDIVKRAYGVDVMAKRKVNYLVIVADKELNKTYKTRPKHLIPDDKIVQHLIDEYELQLPSWADDWGDEDKYKEYGFIEVQANGNFYWVHSDHLEEL